MEQAKQTNSKIRFSGVELLRIIAILLICFHHAIQTAQGMLSLPLNFSRVTLNIIDYGGQIGNILFIICSAWFLLDSKRTKTEKIINLALDSTFISILIFVGFVCGGYTFSSHDIIMQFLPDIFQNVWFVPFYIVFYAIHPLLNGAIEKINKKTHFIVCSIIFAFSIYQVFSNAGMDSLTCFILIYFVVAFFKKYKQDFCWSKKKNLIAFLISFFVFIALVVAKNLLAETIPYFGMTFRLDSLISPVLLPMLIFLFNIFNNMKFKNKAINYLASMSLFVYCFHENILLRYLIRPKFYEYVFGINGDLYFWWIVLCAVGMFVGAYILSLIYKETFHRFTSFLSKQLSKLFAIIGAFLFKIVMKENVQNEENKKTETINSEKEILETKGELQQKTNNSDFWETENLTNK